MKTTYIVVKVDTNDGDYEYERTDVSSVTEKEVEDFMKTLTLLPKTENYHYKGNNQKVITGNKIEFESPVGESTYYHSCALHGLVLDKVGLIRRGYVNEDEVYEDGYIMQKDYDILCKFLPMYLDGGFHSIIGITLEEHTEPFVLKTYEL